MVDLINGQRALILATWSVPFGLTNAVIGILSVAYTLLGSLLQPLFGLLADRIFQRHDVIPGKVSETLSGFRQYLHGRPVIA